MYDIVKYKSYTPLVLVTIIIIAMAQIYIYCIYYAIFIAGSEVNLAEVVDPHTVAGLLKLHFREQRVSMIPRGQPLASITQAVKDKDVRLVNHS